MNGWSYLWEVFLGAFGKIVSFDHETFVIFLFSLKIGILATLAGIIFSLPLAWFAHISRSWLNRFLSVILQALLAIPTVVIGTIVYLLISRRGPLGALEMLYTPEAIILGDFLLIVPLMTVFLKAAFDKVPRGLIETAMNLGAGPVQIPILVMKECRGAITVAVCTGFGRAISEVGCAMILGGNVKGITRTLTTSIALEIGKGETEQSIALGILLVGLAIVNTVVVGMFQDTSKRKNRIESKSGEDPAGHVSSETLSVSEGVLSGRKAPEIGPVVLEGITKKFGDKAIFDGLSTKLDLSGGLAIMGNSGVGKTTLLRLIAGIAKPEAGRIELGNRKPILIFQKPYLFSGTVMENLTIGLRLRGISREAAEESVGKLVQELGLSGICHRSCENLSGGESARTSLGRALAVNPEIILLDESLVHIDAGSMIAINRVLKEFLLSGGGVIMVTHNEEHAKRLCRNMIRLENGKISPA